MNTGFHKFVRGQFLPRSGRWFFGDIR